MANADSIFVPSYGPEEADIVVVGEAPGYQEAKVGKPFVGPSGKLLDYVLTESGIDPDSVYRTNVCLCRPKDNATPSSRAISACSERLKHEINSRRPKRIFALGNTAAQSILGTKTGITQLRAGPPKRSDSYDAEIIPTFHPAACLRQGSSFPSLVTDARKLAGHISVGWEPPQYKVFDDDGQDTRNALTELLEYPQLYVDIEVGVDKEEFDHPDRYDMLCIGIAYKAGRVAVFGEQACRSGMVREGTRKILETTKIGAHNGKFDLAGLKAWCNHNGKLSYDTMLGSYCFDERQGVHALEYVAAEVLGAPSWKSELDRYRGKHDSYAVVPRDVLYRYNAWDASAGWGIADYQEKEFKAEPNLRKLHDFLVEASNELVYPEMSGVVVDLDYNRHLFDTYLDSLDTQRTELQALTGRPMFNANSWKQVKEWLWDEGIEVDSTDADHMQQLLEFAIERDKPKIAEFAGRKLQWAKEAKLYGTYIKGIRSRLYRGRVHPTFLLHGTVSGRISCRNPNLQNIPRGNIIRAQFVPEPGNIFLQGDFAQAELRVLAILSKDAYLCEVFNDPTRDLFDELGTTLYGPRAVGDKGLRIRTKAYAYGLSYGREAASIAYEYKISMAEAQRGMNAFMGRIPQFVEWRRNLKRELLHGSDDLETIFGRRRRFGLITRENQKDVVKEGYSYYPQSTASDLTLSALIKLRRMGVEIRIPVHDSILAEAPIEDADEIAHLMQTTMEETAKEIMGDFVPFPAEVERGPNWGELSS